MIRRFALLFLAATSGLHAEPVAPSTTAAIPVTIDVTHTAPDTWRLQYRFARPVTAIVYNEVGPYRQQAWTVATPGMALRRDKDSEVLSADGKPFDTASIDVRGYGELIEKQYVPASRFTDGGVSLFLGHFQGEVRPGGSMADKAETAEMAADFRLQGLGNESAIAPPAATAAMPMRGYAYFGPQQPARGGVADVIIDPAAEPWLTDTLTDATARLAQYYEEAYGHKLKQRLRLQAAVAGFDKPGLSYKGGAVQGQLVYTFSGQQLKGDHPLKRQHLVKIIAHEMAHVWQLSGDHISVDGHAQWVYEGGADAMAMDALQRTGLWTAAQVQTFASDQQAKCDKLGDTTNTYDGIYACGYARHLRSGKDVRQVWRTLRERSERERAPIGAAMFHDAVGTPAADSRPSAH